MDSKEKREYQSRELEIMGAVTADFKGSIDARLTSADQIPEKQISTITSEQLDWFMLSTRYKINEKLYLILKKNRLLAVWAQMSKCFVYIFSEEAAQKLLDSNADVQELYKAGGELDK